MNLAGLGGMATNVGLGTSIRSNYGNISMNDPTNLVTESFNYGMLASMPGQGSITSTMDIGGRPKIPGGVGSTNNDPEGAVNYPMLVGPHADDSHLMLNEGDIMFCYKTMDDNVQRTEVRTALPLWKLNRGSYLKASKSYEMSTIMERSQKRRHTDENGHKGLFDYDPIYSTSAIEENPYEIYPANSDQFRQFYTFAGVVTRDQTASSFDPNYKAGHDVNKQHIFRNITMVGAQNCVVPILCSTPAYRGQRIWLVGSSGVVQYEASTDSKGRKVASYVDIPVFQIKMHVEQDGRPPSYLENLYTITKTETLQFSDYDPITGLKLPHNDISSMQVQTRALDYPVLQKFGLIKRVKGATPSQTEIDDALVSMDHYRSVMKNSEFTVDLDSRGEAF